MRPVQGGVSIGPLNHPNRVGTLGALVQDNGGTEYILTTNHVLAGPDPTDASPHEVIEQPAHIDGRGDERDDKIAKLSRLVHIDYSRNGRNQVDAAIARVLDPNIFLPGILDIGQISSSPAPVQLGMSIQKMGRSTCLTQGRVLLVNVEVRIRLASNFPISIFSNQIIVENDEPVLPGDAGALVMTNESCPRPVGMLIASDNNGHNAIVTPIRAVLSSLNVAIVGSCGLNPGASASTAIAETDAASAAEAEVTAATATRDSHTGDFEKLPGYVGSGIGMDSVSGQPVIDLLVQHVTPYIERLVPASVETVPLRLVETGSVKPL